MDKSKQASSVYDKIAKPYAEEFSKPSEYITAKTGISNGAF